MKSEPKIRFPEFDDSYSCSYLSDYLTVNTARNKDGAYSKEDVLSVSGEEGIVNQIQLLGRSYAGVSVLDYHIVNPDDIVYTKSPLKASPFGIIKCNKGQSGIVSTLYAVYTPKESVLPSYVEDYFALDSRLNRYLKPIVRIGAKHDMKVSNSAVLEGEVSFPSLSEQKKIADFLSAYDKKISLQKERVETLKEQKKGLLQKMFPKKGETVPELRFPGFTGDWEQRKFSDFAQRESTFRESSSEYPSVEYEDVVAEEGRLNKDVRQKEVQKTGIVFDGSQVLYGKLRPYLHNWLSPDFTGVAVGDWWVLRPVGVDKKFLYRLIQTQQFDEVANQSSGSKMPRADWNLVSNTEFILPSSVDEQRQIAETFDNLDTLITLHQRKLETMQEIKKGLLQQMFV